MSQHLASNIQANVINTQELQTRQLSVTQLNTQQLTASNATLGNLVTSGGDLKADRIQIPASSGSIINGVFIGSFSAITSGFASPNEVKWFPNGGATDGTVSYIKGYTVNLPTGFTANNNYHVFLSIERVTPWGVSPSIASRYVYVDSLYVWDKGMTAFTVDHLRYGNFDEASVINYPLNPQATISYMVVKTV